jgi:hypothetical protein
VGVVTFAFTPAGGILNPDGYPTAQAQYDARQVVAASVDFYNGGTPTENAIASNGTDTVQLISMSGSKAYFNVREEGMWGRVCIDANAKHATAGGVLASC